MDHIITRIKEIIDQEGVSQILFAEKTGINKSTLSHVLTGRNHPSSRVIQKILTAFPHYRHEWLLSGEFPMVKEGYREQQAKQTNIPLFIEMTEDTPPMTTHGSMPCQSPTSRNSPTIAPQTEIVTAHPTRRKIEKIIVYYDDNTYQTFISHED